MVDRPPQFSMRRSRGSARRRLHAPRHGHYRSSPSRRWVKRVAVTLVTLAVLVVIAGATGWFYLGYRLDQIPRVSMPKGLLTVAKAGRPYSVLLVASSQPHPGAALPPPAAAIVVATVTPGTRHLVLQWVPASLVVDIPGKVASVSGRNPIGKALEGGPALMVEAIGADLHMPIEHFAEIDESGFLGLAGRLGLSLYFPMPLEDSTSGFTMRTTGCQPVTGGLALAFLRSHNLYYWHGGSWNLDTSTSSASVYRQQALLTALITRVNWSVTNPFAINGLAVAAAHYLRIDSSWSSHALFSLADQLSSLAPGDVTTEFAPGAPGGTVRPLWEPTACG